MPALVRWGRNHSAEPGTAGRPVIIGIQVDAAPRAGDNEPAAPVALETAVYFICAEALANVAKHARVVHVDVRIRSQSDLVIVLIADDGVGGADPRAGSGLKGVADRVGALRPARAGQPGGVGNTAGCGDPGWVHAGRWPRPREMRFSGAFRPAYAPTLRQGLTTRAAGPRPSPDHPAFLKVSVSRYTLQMYGPQVSVSEPAAATERPLRLASGTISSEVDTCKNKVYRGVYEALRAGMRHRQSPGRRRRPMEPPPGAGADLWPAPLPRPRHRPAGHPQQPPGRASEGRAGRRRHHPAHPPGTDRRDRVRADRRRPGAAARTHRAAALGPALRTRTVPGRRGPARLGTAGRRGPADRATRRADLRAPGRTGDLLPRLRRRHAHRPPRPGTGRRRGGHHARRHLLQPPDRPDDRDRRRPGGRRRRRYRDRPPRPGAARRSWS